MGNSKITILFVRNDLNTFIINKWVINEVLLVEY